MRKYELVQVVGVEEDQENKKNVIIKLENNYKKIMNSETCKFLEIEKGDYVLFQNTYNIIMCYFEKEPKLKQALVEIEEYEKLSEMWRDGKGHSKIRKKKWKEINQLKEEFRKEFQEKV